MYLSLQYHADFDGFAFLDTPIKNDINFYVNCFGVPIDVDDHWSLTSTHKVSGNAFRSAESV